jgi:glutamine---fructose-6-phosphate transaminase (isomerizing)
MASEMRRAVEDQPAWLRLVPTDKQLPANAIVVHTGCGTSFHAAQTAGWAVQALEAVLSPPSADIMVCVSHEGETALTMEAERAFGGDVWLVTGKADSPLAELVDEVIVCTPMIERSWCHTASYTAAVATLQALHGHEISDLPDRVEEALTQKVEAFDEQRVIVVGCGPDWPTANEAALKLREGAWVDATAYHTETVLHGHLAAVDENVRAYVLQGDGRAAERSEDVVAAFGKLGCPVELVPTEHPVVDIVRFQLLTLAVAEARGIDPDPIRRTPGSKWADAAGSAFPG